MEKVQKKVKKTNNSAFSATHTYIKLTLVSFFFTFFLCTFPLKNSFRMLWSPQLCRGPQIVFNLRGLLESVKGEERSRGPIECTKTIKVNPPWELGRPKVSIKYHPRHLYTYHLAILLNIFPLFNTSLWVSRLVGRSNRHCRQLFLSSPWPVSLRS